MTRRELLRLGGSAALLTGLSPLSKLSANHHSSGRIRLFFNESDIPRIRANARTPLLKPLYDKWAANDPSVLTEAVAKFNETGEIIRDLMTAMRAMDDSAAVYLVEPTEERKQSILDAIEIIIARPYWDYFRDGGTEIIGIQRASFTAVHLLLVREILGDAITDDLDKRLMKAIADKGCAPCYNTVYDMDHPETVKGWDFDEQHAGYYDINMDRWPMILGANNLRAAPTGALGLGALALQGIDDRAELWLDTAVKSTERFLKLFSPDGSFFEGISYLAYSMRTTMPFIHAHSQLVGDIDWSTKVNFDGMLDYCLYMQFGKKADGVPDVVNFSDSRSSVNPGAVTLAGQYSGNPLAGYAAKYASEPIWIFDLLWFDPNQPTQAPRKELLNVLNDLDWVVCRSGWEANDAVVAFKSGAPANHEHADRNHIMFKTHGERLLNDHFGAAYDRRHEGWKMRGTRAHNAVLLDGKGHPYLDGIEGTNDSKAYANILQWEDHGAHVWWTSDASSSYILDNYHAHQVLRTVIYAKPDVLVVMDQVRFRYRPQTVDARFFPDNADGNADLKVNKNRFTISRPKAQLHGFVASDSGATPRKAQLEIDSEVGHFPCIEVHSGEALTHHILTVLVATEGAQSPAPTIQLQQSDNTWNLATGDFAAEIQTTSREPKVRIL